MFLLRFHPVLSYELLLFSVSIDVWKATVCCRWTLIQLQKGVENFQLLSDAVKVIISGHLHVANNRLIQSISSIYLLPEKYIMLHNSNFQDGPNLSSITFVPSFPSCWICSSMTSEGCCHCWENSCSMSFLTCMQLYLISFMCQANPWAVLFNVF